MDPYYNAYTGDASGLDPEGPHILPLWKIGPKRPSLLWLWGPNSIMVVYMDPLGDDFGVIVYSTLALATTRGR